MEILILLLIALAFWYPVICIIRPMKPFRSRKMAAWTAAGVLIGIGILGAAVETPKEGQGSIASKGETNKTAVAKEAEAKPAVQVAPKDELDRPEVLSAYCDWAGKGPEIERQSDKLFPNARIGTAAEAKRLQWMKAQDAALVGAIEKEFDIEFDKVMARAHRDGWDTRCRAMEQGRVTVTKAQAQATTPEAAKRAEDALTLNYIDRLERGNSSSPFFNPDRFGVVSCATKQSDGLTLVGCKLTAIARQTQPDTYGVAIGDDGEPVIFPLGGPALQRSEGIRALHDMKNQPIRIGLYTDATSIDFAKARAEFE